MGSWFKPFGRFSKVKGCGTGFPLCIKTLYKRGRGSCVRQVLQKGDRWYVAG